MWVGVSGSPVSSRNFPRSGALGFVLWDASEVFRVPRRRACGLEPLLDLRPEVLVKDGGVRPGPGLLLVPGETAVDRVGQDLVDLAAAERATALHPAVRERLPLGAKVGRYEVALRLGLEKVPVIELGHLSEAEVTAYRIADNRIAELSEWDEGVLWA